MALEPRTHRLAAGHEVATGQTAVGTVGPGARWLVKYVELLNFTGATTSVGLFVDAGDDLSPITFEAALVNTGEVKIVECYAVLNEGDDLVLAIGTGGGGGVYFHVGGLIFQT